MYWCDMQVGSNKQAVRLHIVGTSDSDHLIGHWVEFVVTRKCFLFYV